jgi:hypothetical protein
MSSKKKKKPRIRRHLAQVQRAAPPPMSSESRLMRAAKIASTLGVALLLAALAIQFKVISIDVGANGSLVMKIAGVGLIIAGFVFGRGAKRG